MSTYIHIYSYNVYDRSAKLSCFMLLKRNGSDKAKQPLKLFEKMYSCILIANGNGHSMPLYAKYVNLILFYSFFFSFV